MWLMTLGLRRQWLARYSEGLNLLMILMHLGGGLVSRASELLNIRWANSWTGQRGIILIDDLVALISTYNKIDALKNAPIVIARFLPIRISRLVVA